MQGGKPGMRFQGGKSFNILAGFTSVGFWLNRWNGWDKRWSP
jgi:hypothetical protein